MTDDVGSPTLHILNAPNASNASNELKSEPAPTTPKVAHQRNAVLAGLGAALSVWLLLFGAELTGWPLLVAPFGATLTILFALPKSPLAQPKTVLTAYVLTSVLGLVAVNGLPHAHWVAALSLGLAIALMMRTGWLHPPAGAVPIVLWLENAPVSWSFLFTPIICGVLCLLAMAQLYHLWLNHFLRPAR